MDITGTFKKVSSALGLGEEKEEEELDEYGNPIKKDKKDLLANSMKKAFKTPN
jgi:hypothetical protein